MTIIETSLGNYRFKLDPAKLPIEKDVQDLTLDEIRAAATNLDGGPVTASDFNREFHTGTNKQNLIAELTSQDHAIFAARTQLKILETEGQAQPIPGSESKTDKAPADKAPTDKAPADKAPADKAPADKAPADKAPADKAPADKAPADKAPADKADPKAKTKTDGEGYGNWITGGLAVLGLLITGGAFLTESDKPGKTFFTGLGGTLLGVFGTWFAKNMGWIFGEAKPATSTPKPAPTS